MVPCRLYRWQDLKSTTRRLGSLKSTTRRLGYASLVASGRRTPSLVAIGRRGSRIVCSQVFGKAAHNDASDRREDIWINQCWRSWYGINMLRHDISWII